MKPVQLLPSDAPVIATASSGKPNLGMIGGAILGVVALVGVAGYFAMARVDSVKSETAKFTTDAAAATAETTSVRSQIGSLGKPVVDSDKQLAQGAEQVLVSAYTERRDYVLLARELRGIMDGTGGWYKSVEVASAGAGAESGAESTGVEIVAYMPNEELAAGFNERVDGTRSMSDAKTIALKSTKLADVKSKRVGLYWKFTVTANFEDVIAPKAGGGGDSALASGDGTTVGAAGAGGALTLSLDAHPVARAAAKRAGAPAKPKNPFAVAGFAAGRGGTS